MAETYTRFVQRNGVFVEVIAEPDAPGTATVTWPTGISNLPTAFNPTPHTHSLSQITDFTAEAVTLDLASLPPGVLLTANVGQARPTDRVDLKVLWFDGTGAGAPLALQGDYIVTGTAGLTAVFTDTFTGTNGDAWNATNWVAGRLATGGSATIQTNKGELHTGTVTGSTGRTGMTKTGAAAADGEWAATISFPQAATNEALEIWMRAVATNSATGYFLRIARTGNLVSLMKAVSFTYTSLGSTAAVTIAASTDYKFRFQVSGTTINAKFWLASDSEPGSWTLTATDTDVTTAGLAYLEAQGGTLANAKVLVDACSFSSISSTATTFSVKG